MKNGGQQEDKSAHNFPTEEGEFQYNDHTKVSVHECSQYLHVFF